MNKGTLETIACETAKGIKTEQYLNEFRQHNMFF